MPGSEKACAEYEGTPPRGASPGEGKAKGRVVITTDRCKGCGFCVEFCPTGVLSLGAAMNAKGYHYPEVSSPEGCNGCDICGMLCPDFAIYGFSQRKMRPT